MAFWQEAKTLEHRRFDSCRRHYTLLINYAIMRKKLFYDFKQWKAYAQKALLGTLKGFAQIAYAVFVGIASILYYAANQTGKFYKREPVAATIFSLLLIVSLFGWCATFMQGRVKAETYEHQRDSISAKLSRCMQAYDGSSIIVIDGDTLKGNKNGIQ